MGDEMSGVGELEGSAPSRAARTRPPTENSAGARRLHPDPLSAGRALDDDAIGRALPARSDGGPRKEPETGGGREVEDWARHAAAARRANRLERADFDLREMELGARPKGGRAPAWEVWEAQGGPYSETEGPMGSNQGGRSRGYVKLALDGREGREGKHGRVGDRCGAQRRRDESPSGGRKWDRSRQERSTSSDRSGRPFHKETKPDKFDGTSSVEAFLEQFHTCAQYNRWKREDKYVHLKLCLKGSAAGLLRDCREDVLTFEALEDKLRQRFDAKGREAAFRAQLKARKRRRGESLQDLYINIADLIHQAYPGRGSEHKDAIACSAFVDALDDPSLEQRVSYKDPRNLDDAYRSAVTMEANTRGAEQRRAQEGGRWVGPRADARAAFEGPGGFSEAVVAREVSAGHSSRKPENHDMEEMKKMVENLCQTVNNFCINGPKKTAESSSGGGTGSAPRKTGGCFICQDATHWAAQCPWKGQTGSHAGVAARMTGEEGPGASVGMGPGVSQGARFGAGESLGGNSGRQCHRCREMGHIARECPNRQSDDSRERGGQQSLRTGATVCGSSSDQPVYLTLTYGRYRLSCLLDTGCQRSIMPSKWVQGVGLGPVEEDLFAANGTKIATQGTAEVPLRLGGMYLPVKALVTDHVRKPMLGVDWMLANECVLNFKDLTVTVRGRTFPLERRESTLACRRVVVARRVEVPAWCQAVVEGRVELDSLNEIPSKEYCT